MPLATFSHLIGLATYIVLRVPQCEHTISSFNINTFNTDVNKATQNRSYCVENTNYLGKSANLVVPKLAEK